ncbi:MAG: alpha/beta fold hydrolase [Paracoccaceae bacterium]|uniref:alpha/beta fold hydrolase n=1 Tax=Sedimentitalea sp. TaxID=2048915 RepID=UPI003264E6D8
MKNIILVHGMNATSASWNTIPASLEAAGNNVANIQLPGHDRPLDIWSLLLSGAYSADFGMDAYVSEVVNAFPEAADQKVILIGHSMGGAVISHAAAQFPERIESLIYVTAMLPDQGQSARDIIELARNDPTFSKEGFLGDYWQHLRKLKFVQQPSEPLSEAFTRGPEFNSLKRAYIRCTGDDVIPLNVQNAMIAAYAGSIPATEVKTLDQSHLPQYDNPKELYSTINRLIR